MASLLNNASLLLNPAGSVIAYEEDKIFSVLPTNGDGDFTFYGGDGGTRVNQQGYVEQTPANLFTDSNNFSTWSPKAGTFVQGQADPFGGNNAWAWTATNTDPYLYQSLNFSGTYTVSFYAKGIGSTIGDNFQIRVGGAPYGEFTLTDQWKRYEWSGPLSGTSNIGVELGNPAVSGDVIHIAFAQLNIGSTASPYQPTTDRLDYPRINFQDGAGALLTEDQRTNLIDYSTDFSQWSAYNSPTLTTGQILGPDNASYATTIEATDAATFKGVSKVIPITGNATYGFSVFVKKLDNILDKYPGGTATANNVRGGFGLVFSGGTQKVIYVSIDESIGGYNVLTDQNSNIQVYVEEFKDYYRYLISTQDTGANTSITITLYAILSRDNAVTTGLGETTYWGAHFEAMVTTSYEDYPSSYIPTNGSTVTRRKDEFKTSTLSNVITGQEITWYAHMRSSTDVPNAFGFRVFSSSPSGWLGMYRNTTGAVNDGSGALYPSLGNYQLNTPLKIVAKVGGGTYKYFVNGVQKSTGAFAAPGSWISFENSDINQSRNYRTFAVYNEALSDAQCQELSTVNSGSGGDYYIDGAFTVHKFTSSGTFNPSFTGQAEVLIVAGGGGGGNDNAGGGGAGGVLYSSAVGVNANGAYTITVGAGGAGRSVNYHGLNGSNSSAFGLEAIGGGGGGAGDGGGGQTPPIADLPGRDGGSGGGGASESGNGPGGEGVVGQGNNGGSGLSGGGGGGGGASTAGDNSTGASQPGNGGDGLEFSITGFPTYYGGGGGGSTENAVSVAAGYGLGGLGGGGNGGYGVNPNDTMAQEGNTNTGGGGGGQPYPNTGRDGANGGSGIVIIRYLT